MSDPIKITVELDQREAWVLAQFLKRVSYTTCERHADPHNKDEPYEMIHALEKVRGALRDQGIAPR
jgi:hypothetical protein